MFLSGHDKLGFYNSVAWRENVKNEDWQALTMIIDSQIRIQDCCVAQLID